PDSDPNQLQTTPNWLNNALLRTHYTDNNNNHNNNNDVTNGVNNDTNVNGASNFLNLQTASDSAAVQNSGQWLSRSILHRHHGEVIDDVSVSAADELGDLKGEGIGGKGETVVGDGGGGLVNWQMGRWKAEIMAHPLYEQLLSAHVACLRIATPVDQLPRIDAQLAQSQNVVAKYSAFGQN
ncbi:homeobox protein knotted-1-like 3-like, partial [Trifolium medium]|nr:homeobox protein knotted-1-like 3-like [Trifolium medium]